MSTSDELVAPLADLCDRDPLDLEAEFGLAASLARSGQTDEAVVRLRSLLQRDPAHRNAAALLQELTRPPGERAP